MSLFIRPMQLADISAVHAVQCEAYPAFYHEPAEALCSHLLSGPQTCLIALAEEQPGAYVLAYPWCGDVPLLHQPLQAPQVCDHLFVHDLAVVPSLRSCGAASALVVALMDAAARLSLSHVRLVSLIDAASFWRKHGFSPIEDAAPPSCYGAALLMHRSL